MSYEAVGRAAWNQFAGVSRLRRALLLLAVAACTAAALLYWRQQTDDNAHRPLRNTLTQHVNIEFPLRLLLKQMITTRRQLGWLNGDPHWSWLCKNGRCERMLASETPILQSLQTCNMLCASTQLWPQPTGPISLATTAVPVMAKSFTLNIIKSPSNAVTDHLKEAFLLMKKDLELLERRAGGIDVGTPRSVDVEVSVNGSGDPRLLLRTDESYKLIVTPDNGRLVAEVKAHSFCGARHAFETLSQLVWLDPYARSLLALEAANIKDSPKFPYRGLLLDTARNYFPVSDILRTIDAMSASKLNTFHWHATDSQSFPIRFKSVPELATHGAYGPEAIYTPEDIRTVVKRARLRGIRVVIEVDAPAHVGRAWSWGPAAGIGELAHCVEAEPWSEYCGEPPCGQLNPKNLFVYEILGKIYREILELTEVDDVFHLGGDEVSESCWSLHFNSTSPMLLWLEFTKRSLKLLQEANKGSLPELVFLWSSPLTRSPYLSELNPKQFGVQIWGSSRWPESHAVLNAGYRAVISHVDAWYLDCGFGSWRDDSPGPCQEYHNWQHMYKHRPWISDEPGDQPEKWKIDGGVACQWSEQLATEGLDARVWPRASALAERLWSDIPDTSDQKEFPDIYIRMDTHRERLVARGVRAAPIWPRWCSQNPYDCH